MNETIAIASMKSEFGNHPCFIVSTNNFSVSLLFSTFSFRLSFISVWPLSSFFFFFLSYYFSPFAYPHLSPYSTFFRLSFFFPFSFHHSYSFPFVLLTFCFLFLHHGPTVSFSLSVYVSLFLSPSAVFIPPFIYFFFLYH